MATSKTLTPTNVTISIPEMTDRPDQSVNSNCIDKEADAINALNSKTPSIKVITDTVTVNTSDGTADMTDSFITTSCTCFVQILRSNSTTWAGITASNRITENGKVSITFRNADGSAVASNTSIRVAVMVTKE